MIIFETMSSFTAFILFACAVLALVYLFDGKIRKAEDKVISFVKSRIFTSAEKCKIESITKNKCKNKSQEKIA